MQIGIFCIDEYKLYINSNIKKIVVTTLMDAIFFSKIDKINRDYG